MEGWKGGGKDGWKGREEIDRIRKGREMDTHYPSSLLSSLPLFHIYIYIYNYSVSNSPLLLVLVSRISFLSTFISSLTLRYHAL